MHAAPAAKQEGRSVLHALFEAPTQHQALLTRQHMPEKVHFRGSTAQDRLGRPGRTGPNVLRLPLVFVPVSLILGFARASPPGAGGFRSWPATRSWPSPSPSRRRRLGSCADGTGVPPPPPSPG